MMTLTSLSSDIMSGDGGGECPTSTHQGQKNDVNDDGVGSDVVAASAMGGERR